MRTSFLTALSLLLFIDATAQAPKRSMPRNINMRGYNSYAPAISGDGNSMVFLSNFTNDESIAMMYTRKVSASSWSDPEEMPHTFNLEHLTYAGGYALNFDGSRLYFTFRKSGGMGGHDIWFAERNASGWGGAQNLGNVINSSAHEGMPSISADDQYLFFSRCESMNNESASGCKIYMAKRRGGNSWESPVALPDNVNTGEAMSPTILADGETLIFSSDRAGGKGGMDMFMTRKEGDSWTDPVAMDFVNTAGDDQFMSVAAKGRYLYHDIQGERGKEIELLLIPDDFKPKNTMRITGSANYISSGEVTPAYLKVYDVNGRERVFYDEIGEGDKGDFNFVIKEGGVYDLSIEPKDGLIPYFSKVYDIREMRSSTRDELEVMLKPMKAGDSLLLDAIVYENNDTTISDVSTYELRRLTRFLKNNNSSRFEIRIQLDGYRFDTVQSDPMLTEVVMDTVMIEKPVELVEVDSMEVQLPDSLVSEQIDTLTVEMDSLAMVDEDMEVVEEEPEPEFIVNYTYHNDRTMAQANALKSYLLEHGIAESQVSVTSGRKDAMADQVNTSIEVYLKRTD